MIYFVLISIFILWIFFAFIRHPLSKIIGFKLCAICAAVSGTWIGLWIMRFIFNYRTDSLILGILMGQSVAGLMYTFEKHVKNKGYNNTWLLFRIFIITLGALFVYLIVKFIY